MIEMSVEKETVLPDDTKVNPRGHLQPRQLTECTESLNSAPKAAEAAMATSGNAGTTFTRTVTAFTGSGMLMDKKIGSVSLAGSCGKTGSMELEAKKAGAPFQPKNGMQQLAQEQQQQSSQPQRVNKRRNTMNIGFKHPGSGKRRRRANSESDPVLPTNFLLGGNIFDPLNLNSLLDEEVNRAINAETPKSSPLPAKSRDPVEILIPRDITDPLNLNSSRADAGILASPLKSRKRHRNRHHGGGGAAAAVSAQPDTSEPEKGKGGEGCTVAATGRVSVAASALPEAARGGDVSLNPSALPESTQPCELDTSVTCRDAAALPVLPQGAAEVGPQSVQPLAAPASQHQGSRQRKRRRASSKSEPATPSPLVRKPGGEKGQRPWPGPGRPTQTFHTPASGAGGGRGGQPQPHGRRKQQQKFQYGNYNKYYGYRNPGWSEDPRMRVLQPEWFRGKDVLDLGCNTGHLTLSIAKNWQPSRIVGLDIDGALVHAARQNIRHYLSEVQAKEARFAEKDGLSGARGPQGKTTEERERSNGGAAEDAQEADGPMGSRQQWSAEASGTPETPTATEGTSIVAQGQAQSLASPDAPHTEPLAVGYPFPVSLKISRGPIAAPPIPDICPVIPGDFPANVSFVRGNYVLESDALLQSQRPEYDVILCLSVTKWVHLNWGDVGLQRLFHRVYHHLRPGGLFILEPQPWASYGKRKKLTDIIFKNYHSIRFKPDQFSSFLTSEVGFSSYELIGTPKSSTRGFQRPIYLFHKGPSSHRE